MAVQTPVVVTGATEGIVDEAVIRRLVREVGAEAGPVHGKNGKSHLRKHINGYNNAAQFSPWIVLVDLDQEAECAPPLRSDWLTTPAQYMCFRIAVREVEAWLLADRENIAKFLGVAVSRIPSDVETLQNPKETIVNLASESRRRDIREDMVPRRASGRPIGPAYASRLIEFAEKVWAPRRAAKQSDSLSRSIECLKNSITEYARSMET